MGLFGSNQVVGIDLGFASIKVVGLTIGKKPAVIGFGEASVDPTLLQKEGLEDPTDVVEALKDAMKMALPKPIKGSDAYLSVSEASVFRKILEVPRNVTGNEMSAVVRAGVVEFLPEDLDSLELDYQVLATPKDSETQQVMVVAVSKKAIEQYLNLCKKAGLTVRGIDPKPSALLRSVLGPKVTEPTVIIDIGSETSSISLCGSGAVWVASAVTIGANSLKDPATGKIDTDQKGEKMTRLAGGLADELDHVVKFFANRASGTAAEIKQVRFTGGGSLTEGFVEMFAKETGLEVTLAKPAVAVPPAFNNRFMGALGSALYPLFEQL